MEATSGHRGREGRRIWANLGGAACQQEGESPTSLSSEFPGYTVSSAGGSGNSPSRKFLPSQLRDKARKEALNCRDLLQESWQPGLLGAGEEEFPEVGMRSRLFFCC